MFKKDKIGKICAWLEIFALEIKNEKVYKKDNSNENKKSIRGLLMPKYAINFIPTYNQDGLATSHVCHFMQDNLFKESYNISLNHNSQMPRHRLPDSNGKKCQDIGYPE